MGRQNNNEARPVKRVLLIDDDDSIREVAQASLEIVGGWLVSTARGGAEGHAIAAAEQPDVILLDVMMPGMDGPTTFAAMQSDPRTRHIPVIFLTAKLHPAEQQQWGDLQIAGVLAKPFDPMRLPTQISDALGWQP